MMKYPLQLVVIFAGLVYQFNEAFSQGILSDFVLLKTPHTFRRDASSCERAEWRKIVESSKSSPTKAPIATYQNQMWQIEEAFREEFTTKENHLLLNSAKFTDQGQYEFVCNGNGKLLKLDVLYAIDVHVKEMDNITLDCYADSANNVTWLHNKERVLHYKEDGSMNPGEGYEGRVSVKKNCFKTGNISLTITGVLETDAGMYRCFVDNETIKGYPHTYNLIHVNEKRSSPGDQTDCNCNETHSLITYKSLTIVLGIISNLLLLVTVILIVTLIVLYRKCTSATDTDHEPKSDENDCMIMEDTASPNNDNEPRVRHSVQESEPTENKPSNTKPF